MRDTILRPMLAPFCMIFAAVFGLTVSACSMVRATPSDRLAVSSVDSPAESPVDTKDTTAATGANVTTESSPTDCRNPQYHPQCNTAEDAATCKEFGGTWQTCLGRMCRPGCLCATPRGGCPCKSGADCANRLCLTKDRGVPVANAEFPGICQRTEPMFGCLEHLIVPGQPPMTICID